MLIRVKEIAFRRCMDREVEAKMSFKVVILCVLAFFVLPGEGRVREVCPVGCEDIVKSFMGNLTLSIGMLQSAIQGQMSELREENTKLRDEAAAQASRIAALEEIVSNSEPRWGCCKRWENWAEWSNCSAECGFGTRTRHRECIGEIPTKDSCVATETEQEGCFNGPCPTTQEELYTEPQRWGEWTEWSSCSPECGDGTRERHRICNTKGECVGVHIQRDECFNGPCTTAPVPTVSSDRCPVRRGGRCFIAIRQRNKSSRSQHARACWIKHGGKLANVYDRDLLEKLGLYLLDEGVKNHYVCTGMRYDPTTKSVLLTDGTVVDLPWHRPGRGKPYPREKSSWIEINIVMEQIPEKVERNIYGETIIIPERTEARVLNMIPKQVYSYSLCEFAYEDLYD